MINDYLDTDITISSASGLDGYGKPTFSAPFAAKCRWQPVSRLKQKPMGDNIIIAVKMYLGPEVNISNNDRVTKGGTNYQVIEVNDRNFVGYGSHKEILLKYE